ncbi:BolA-like protein [Octadecabacter antarcticus 307]|uniref:DNA-binding transcriptional regulator BolA n=1 Tax=Octadecabacter antarcticus 307 TaxID=391626 RepID=M9R1J8_9RHOB|nr:BolA/IbaG family iron-sulfur metabolism protein [Octadecabacter antarcticus]AGI66117.1 BolA-like protein [Octadecabacter antarcticus 307]
MTIRQDIIDKLRHALPVGHLEVINESHKHNVPEGAESHFKVVIVSPAFEGKTLVARHRLLNGILAEALSTDIHALALHTMTKDEWFISREAPASPPCMGGGVHR